MIGMVKASNMVPLSWMGAKARAVSYNHAGAAPQNRGKEA
jgi:hypothetical protein